MGTINLPPGWQKICNADLCEPCCMLVRDFIRFTPADAARLPVEPVESVAPLAPVGDKLFETAPVKSLADVSPERGTGETGCASSVGAAPEVEAGRGNPEINPTVAGDSSRESQSGTSANPSLETSTEERVRTRAANRRKKLAGADPPPPDAQPGAEPGAQP